MRIRRQTVEHPFGALKAWMGSTHFPMKTLKHVKTADSIHIDEQRIFAIRRQYPSRWVSIGFLP
jgi:hypothetical protein